MGKNRVVEGNIMFFKDDIKILDTELAKPLAIPSELPILFRDELQILYNGHIFVAVHDDKQQNTIKVYTQTYGLQEIASPKEQEQKYFSDNKTLVDKLKSDFISRVITGNSGVPLTSVCEGLKSELTERINKEYASLLRADHTQPPGKGIIAWNDDGSIFNTYIPNCERVLLLDNKIYLLSTIPEYISIFKGSFEPNFYKECHEFAKSGSPEEVSHLIDEHRDRINPKAIPSVKNKIWHSPRSFKLFLDSMYWIPMYKDKTDGLISLYSTLLERQIKMDASSEYHGN
jgi:hypothetical protein